MKRALLAGWAAWAVLIAAPAARAVDQEAVNRAIEAGVQYLHGGESLDANPTGSKTQPDGVAALIGLTLLECDAKPDDPVLRKCLQKVRDDAVAMHETYSLSLCIVFLDRLGDPADEPLIQSMAVRLLGGQSANGGWTYTCPAIPESEVRRLTDLIQHPDQVVTPDKKDPDAKPGKLTVKDLPKEIQDQLAHLNSLPAPPVDTDQLGMPDNSNTQFGALGLWVARRHGMPVDKALERLDHRFRTTQHADGGWGYVSMGGPGNPPGPGAGQIPGPGLGPAAPGGVMGGSTATMTCAGVMCLAVARGPKAEAAVANGKTLELSSDAVLKSGLAALGTAVGAPVGKDGKPASAGGKTFYFLWSLERVGVILDQDKIGGHDWYDWGAEILVANQNPDGAWRGDYPPAVDTCFALLFLKRANVARDLTSLLKGKTDLGVVTLKGDPNAGNPLKGVEPPPGKPKPDDPVVTPVKPPAAGETEGARMARELAQASADRRDELLQQYKEGKGVVYTEALAGAIPQLGGEDKRKAREALAERLTRMKAEVLSRYFQDGDGEIRRAAALASAMKGAK
ncbi:MAG TPA: hypothetical protein VMS17_03230, partial [Gemmataceae bacterium]|nr:hypothetical protein [Gemmataceae bacterium]